MAFSSVTTDATELSTQRLGYIAITLTNWTAATEPEVTAGSTIEVGGTLYYNDAALDIDPSGDWAGFAANTQVYAYFIPAAGAITSKLTTTAPTWDTAKQGYYGTGGSATYRYYAMIWKDASGNYDLKKIITGRDTVSIYKNQDWVQVFKASDAGPVAATEDAWTKTTLGTNDNNTIAGASLVASVIALPAGYYCFDGASICFLITSAATQDTVTIQLRLRNTSDGTTITDSITGTYVDDGKAAYFQALLPSKTYFSLSAAKNFELQYNFADTDNNVTGQYYKSEIVIRKISEIE